MDIERKQLGRSGVAVSRIGLGTAPIGGLFSPVSDENARATLDTAWRAGIRYFDTAPHYGVGLAERRLGAFLKSYPRDEFVVSTKVGRVLVQGTGRQGDECYWGGPDILVRRRAYSRDGVLRSLEDSLDRSGLSHFDIVLIHDPDEYGEVALRHAYPALATLRDQGIVRAIGVGMNQCQMLCRFVNETDIDMVLVAGRYSLLDRTAQAELLPLCRDRGVAVVVGGVFNSGVLVAPTAESHFDYQDVSPPILRHVSKLAELCAVHAIPLGAAAIQFPLRSSAVSAILVGARSAEELRADLDFLCRPVPAGLWNELEATPYVG